MADRTPGADRGPAVRLAVLLVFCIIAIVPTGPFVSSALFAGAAAAFLLRLPATRRMLPGALTALVVAALAGLYRGLSDSPAVGIEAFADLAGCVLLACAIVASTPTDRIAAVVGSLVRPLRRFGVDRDRVELLVLLMLTAIPRLGRTLRSTREAATARGTRDPRALLMPLSVRAVGDAHAVAEALVARGIADRE